MKDYQKKRDAAKVFRDKKLSFDGVKIKIVVEVEGVEFESDCIEEFWSPIAFIALNNGKDPSEAISCLADMGYKLGYPLHESFKYAVEAAIGRDRVVETAK
jgi:hypothetical protein